MHWAINQCKRNVIRAGVPVIPGSDGVVADREQAHEVAESWDIRLWSRHLPAVAARESASCVLKMNWIRHLRQHKARRKQLLVTIQMYMEKVIEHARHIEVQVLGDHFGNVIHLGERDCSLQLQKSKSIRRSTVSGIV